MSKQPFFIIKNVLIWGMLICVVLIILFGIFMRFENVTKELSKIPTELENNLSTFADDNKNGMESSNSNVLNILPPVLEAKAFLVMDVKSDQVLFSQNPDMQLPPASLTKIMTAVVAIEEYNLSKTVVVPEKCVGLNGSSIGFKANEVFTMEDLLYGLLVKSGADAACAVANISSEAEFLVKMNAKAKEIGLEKTVFQNEIGFDAENNQLTSVEDIRKLSLYALNISTFRKIVGTKNATIKNLNTGTVYAFQNTNDLLFTIPGTVGIKTGTTEKAGQCLTYLYQNRDREILVVLLGSQDRFKDTTALLNWANEELDYRSKEL